MNHPMAVGTQKREIPDVGAFSWFEQVNRPRVVALYETPTPLSVSLTKIEATCFTKQAAMVLQEG